ncbi:MAG: ASKHA domain-containing protein [Steroidobacteraceae bacterium]
MSEPPRQHRLMFCDVGREIEGLEGESVLHAARRAGVRIVGACGGRGTCGSCMVRVAQGLAQHHRWRRACQSRIRSDCTIQIAPRSLAPVVRAEVGHREDAPLVADSAIAGRDITVPPASLADHRSDWDRVAEALDAQVPSPDLDVLSVLPGLLRTNAWSVRVRLEEGRVLGFAAPGRRELGLAVDLGTTNLAAFLIRLDTGERLASLGIENPQAAWGGDVISRINHAIQAHDGAEELRAAVVRGIDAITQDLVRAVGAEVGDVVEAAVCGNTAMHHLLAGLPVTQLGRSPFVPVVSAGLTPRATALGLALAPGARVHLAPNIGGFVGGDHVAALLASEQHWRSGCCLVMDIGTNTEISLIHESRIISASCPSGPALEGGHVSCGMRAAIGAIERVKVEAGRLRVSTIGRKKAVGVCGSGVLDAMAALLEGGMMERSGRIRAGHPDVEEIDGLRSARLAKDIHFTQHDVRAVQLAKSAIRTGMELLLRQAGIEATQLERIVIAGAFGAYLSVDSAVDIGLLPDLPRERFLQVGNAAGLGVCRMLVNRADRARAQDIARGARYLELSSIADFQQHFLKHISLNGPWRERKIS